MSKKPLPERIGCDQDVQDIFDHFEHEANEYVQRRLSYFEEPDKGQRRRVFRYPNDVHWVTVAHVRELCAILGVPVEEGDRSIPMRWALNMLGSYVETISSIRNRLGLPEVQDKTSTSFYYPLADKVRALYSANDLVRSAIEKATEKLLGDLG